MASYYLAPSLKALGFEVTKTWPRAKPWPTVGIGDGWIGDASHNARKSDHNPDWDAGGIVRAVDIGIEGRDAQHILKAAIGDSRVWYVIHKGRIYSRTHGWESRAYSGSNPHNHHIHISIRHDRDAAVDVKPWLTTAPAPQKAAAPKPAPATTEETDMSVTDIAAAVWNFRLTPDHPPMRVMVPQIYNRTRLLLGHAQATDKNTLRILELLKTAPGVDQSLADQIIADVKQGVSDLDIEINVKE